SESGEAGNTEKENKEEDEKKKTEGKGSMIETLPGNVTNLKYMASAINNVKTAENLGDVLELIKELESLEYENYSKLSYLGPELSPEELRKVKIDRNIATIIADTFFPEAMAQDEDV